MKKYALSLDTFNRVSELFETIQYLRQELPGFARKHLDDYFADNILENKDERENKERLSLILIFEDHFMDKKDAGPGELFSEVYRESKVNTPDKERKQQILKDLYSMTQEEMLAIDHTLNLDRLVEKGLLIEFTEIQITFSEIETRLITSILATAIDRQKSFAIIEEEDDEPELGFYETIEEGTKKLSQTPVGDIMKLITKIKVETHCN